MPEFEELFGSTDAGQLPREGVERIAIPGIGGAPACAKGPIDDQDLLDRGPAQSGSSSTGSAPGGPGRYEIRKWRHITSFLRFRADRGRFPAAPRRAFRADDHPCRNR